MGYVIAILFLCAPSFLFVLGSAVPPTSSDLVQIAKTGVGFFLALVALPLTGLAIATATWASFRRNVGAETKVVIWTVVILSILAIVQMNAAVRRMGA
jgi:hypothetical protein